MKLKCSSDLRWNSHCGHGRKTILIYRIYIILQFLYHIRTWDEDYEKAGKGMTFSAQELIALKELLNQLPLEDYLEEDEEE